MKLKDGTKTLTEGEHYTLTLKNNTKPGTATATIKGTGSYTGTLNYSFAADPYITLSSVKVLESGKVTIKWKSDEGYDGYNIYSSSEKSTGYTLFKRVKDASATSYTSAKPLQEGKTFYFKVSGYYEKNEGKYTAGRKTGYRAATIPTDPDSAINWEGVYRGGEGEFMVVLADKAGALEVYVRVPYYGDEVPEGESWINENLLYYRGITATKATTGYFFAADYGDLIYKIQFKYGGDLTRKGKTITWHDTTFTKTNEDPYELVKDPVLMIDYGPVYVSLDFTSYHNAFADFSAAYWKNMEWKNNTFN